MEKYQKKNNIKILNNQINDFISHCICNSDIEHLH